jgi:trimeric autotransporter adhesin
MRVLLKVLPLGTALICLGVIFLTVGCGSNSARFRYVQASTGAPSAVDVQVDGKNVLTDIAYGLPGSYQKITSGSRSVSIFQNGTTTNPLFTGSVSFGSGDTTLISENVFSSITLTPYADDNTAPSSGNVKLRFINAGPSVGSVDVYVVTSGTGIGGLNRQLNLTYPSASGYISVAAGNYDVVITQAGTQNVVSGLNVSYTFAAGQIRTIVIIDSAQGGAPYNQLVLSDLN